ncbi:hypothetical protein [Neomegalonema perideroedes]|uniref:hypothetical protein n=1 Tax=Neomegalonema perideroedes TaxID=217219 RepID=UPI00037B8C3F|nr:hypothetical protein [Neomegalonema perideroedes]
MRLPPAAASDGRDAHVNLRIRFAQDFPSAHGAAARPASGWEEGARREESRVPDDWRAPKGPPPEQEGGSEPVYVRRPLREIEPDPEIEGPLEEPPPEAAARREEAEPKPGSLAHRLREMRAEASGEGSGPQAAGGAQAAAVAAPDPRRWAAETYARQAQPPSEPEEPQEEEPSPARRLLEALFSPVRRIKEAVLEKILRLLGAGGGSRASQGAEEEGRGGEARGEGRRNGGSAREEAMARARREAGTPLEATPNPHQLQT